MQFSPNGQFLAVAPGDHDTTKASVGVFLLDAKTLDICEALEVSNRNAVATSSIRFSSDSKHLAAEKGNSYEVWDLSSRRRQTVKGANGALTEIVDSGRFIATYDGKGGDIRVYQVDTGAKVLHVYFDDYRNEYLSAGVRAACSPAGRLIAVGGRPAIVVCRWPGKTTTERIGASTLFVNTKAIALPGHSCCADMLAFSRDGKLLASGDESGMIRLWDLSRLEFDNVGEAQSESARREEASPARPSNGGSTEWTTIFGGDKLDGWKPIGNARWHVQNKCLTAQGERGYLVYRPDGSPIRDIEIEADVRINAAGNSGLFLRCDPSSPTDGYEVQIAGTDAPALEYHTGSIYGSGKNTAPDTALDDTWFKLHVTVVGSRIVVRINGRVVTEQSDTRRREGYLAIQQWTPETKAQFANIRIRRPSEDNSSRRDDDDSP